MTWKARAVRFGVGFLLVVVAALVVTPGRAWVGQREAIAEARVQLADLKKERKVVARRVSRLESRDNIERQASETLGLVYIGDGVYTLDIDLTPQTVDLPDVWPFNRLEEPLREVADSR